jgi:hypothetical protein
MTGAVATAAPAAPAAGNATLLSAGDPPAEPTPETPPHVEPKDPVEPGPETDPVEPPKEGDDPPKEGEPEQYTFTAPEGVTLDAGAVEAFTPVAHELKLNQEQAQKLVSVYADLQQRQAEAHTAQVAEWAKAVTTDKELGGAKWPETQALIARARDQFASPELLQVMDQTGLGSHPAVVKLFARLGKEIADDRHTTGGGQPSQPDDFATSYFAKMPKRERVSS